MRQKLRGEVQGWLDFVESEPRFGLHMILNKYYPVGTMNKLLVSMSDCIKITSRGSQLAGPTSASDPKSHEDHRTPDYLSADDI
jgi:hypothetical protein